MVNKKTISNLANYSYVFYTSFLSLIWIIFNYGGKGLDPYTGSGIRWYLITIPLMLYILVNIFLIILNGSVRKSYTLYFILFYFLFSVFTSIIYLDIKHFSEIFRWALPLFFILLFRVNFPLVLLNGIYIFAIFYSVITYNQLVTDYGFLPGQTSVNLHQGMWWRVSVWKYLTPPYSAAFSILIFFTNYYYSKGLIKILFLLVSTYFILLSGSRTGYFIFLFGFLLLTLIDESKFKFNKIYCFIPIFMTFIIIFLQLASDIIPFLNIDNEILSSAILRNPDSSGDTSNLSSRILIIIEHVNILGEGKFNGIFGVGSEIYTSNKWTSNGGSLGGSADSYISHLIVRDGISIIFLVISFICLYYRAMVEKNLMGYVILNSLLIYTIGYGAWLNFTSPVFLLFLGFLFHKKV